jgi:methylenetetrahydrofolate--tRNA-(uracil-5-)-methyltransferase
MDTEESDMDNTVIIIGAGLAGTEAAYQIAKRGIKVKLFEMRPKKMTEIHETGFPAEMVCSNSLGSTDLTSALGLLKKELTELDSFFLKEAEKFRVPAGKSFSVDRHKLAEHIKHKILNMKNIEYIENEITEIPNTAAPVIIATGPLTSIDFADKLTKITRRRHLFFFDATSPIIDANSIDTDKVYFASRYDKGEADFLNIPLNKEQYHELVKDLNEAEKVAVHEFENDKFFESCLPVEEIARRGEKSLAFGPLKPVGLIEPKTGKMPYAVIQLRQDDLNKNFYQLVGFQTRLKYGEQKRIFSKLPGLENARFERYGRMHKNTYINAPLIIDRFNKAVEFDNIYFAGQISGVEGYVESVSSGLFTGIVVAKRMLNKDIKPLPLNTAAGSLFNYISSANWKNFTPTKFTFGLLPDIQTNEKLKGKKKEIKKIKKLKKSERAINELKEWIKTERI